MNSLRYQPTEGRFSVVSVAFQLWGTVIVLQPVRSSWSNQRSDSPTKASSWRKYHVPPSSSRSVWPSRMSGLPPGASTRSSGATGGGVWVPPGGASPPPCANAGRGQNAATAMLTRRARLSKRRRVAALGDARLGVSATATVSRPAPLAMNRRFAIIQALVSLVALAAVVWWASRQDSPHIPTDGAAIAWLVAAVGLYAVATLVRAERWHQILELTGVHAKRIDCYALTTVGYMGNNVLPARAGEALRVVLLAQRSDGSKRTLLGSVVAERMLDLIALITIFVVTVYGVLSTSEVLPTDHPLIVTGIGVALVLAAAVAIWVLRAHHVFERVRDWLRPLADAPRALLNRQGAVLLAGTFVLWSVEATVYLAVGQAIDLDFSVSGALYLVALTNFVAALPAAPGSIGTFDAAVVFGAKALGATGSAALSYVILLRFVLYVPITVFGLVVLVTRYGGWSRLRSAASLEASRAEASRA